MKKLLIAFVWVLATLQCATAQQTAKAPAKKQSTTKKTTTGVSTGKPTASKPAANKPATRTQTALPTQKVPAKSPENATALPNKGSAKTAASPTSSGGGGGENATKLSSGGTTVTPTPPSPGKNSSSSPRSNSSYRSSPSRSGKYSFGQGDHLLNFGLGLGYSGYYSSALPIGASYEYGVTPDISIGAQIDFALASYYSSYYYYNYSRNRYLATYIGLRGSYHFNRLIGLDSDKLDLYAGVGVGYRSYSNYYDYYRPVFVNGFVGGKFYFTDSVGGFVELGYTGLSYSKIGLSLKF